jgi:tRNA threonylcarbamoyladenosine biosynthesis protein TsaE
MHIIARTEEQTAALAQTLAAGARPGNVFLLEGPLGAGKTSFARAFIRALTGDAALVVPSPTFTLVQSYDTPAGTVWHYDLWRLADHRGLEELGWEEALTGILLVEWPDRLGPFTPAIAVRVALSLHAEGREIDVTGGGHGP